MSAAPHADERRRTGDLIRRRRTRGGGATRSDTDREREDLQDLAAAAHTCVPTAGAGKASPSNQALDAGVTRSCLGNTYAVAGHHGDLAPGWSNSTSKCIP